MMTVWLCWAAIAAFEADTDGAKSAPDLLTVAEKSNYRATARHAEVVELGKRLAQASSGRIHYEEFGKSVEGRALPALVIANPRISSIDSITEKRSDRLVVLVYANIHAGEVCGKEALPMLAREFVEKPDHPLLKNMILVFVPILNADGNERVSKTNRPTQDGPVEGMGQRENAHGLDLNRDWMKLETPEIQAMVRLFRRFDPDVIIDTHTTNGSRHRYTLTYEGPKNPAGSQAIVEYVRDEFLPAAGALLTKKTGYQAFYYGNFEKNNQLWTSYPAQPRYSTNYQGLQHQIAILSEAYSYAPYKDRVIATREFVRSCLEQAASQADKIRELRDQARQAASKADSLPLQTKVQSTGKTFAVAGYEREPGKPIVEGKSPSKDYQAEWINEHVGTIFTTLPWAYVIPPGHKAVVENLQRHGIVLEELREDLETDVETYRIEEFQKSESAFQGHKMTLIDKVSTHQASKKLLAGSALVKTAQPLGHLAALLLEPQSEDGLCAWNLFDAALAKSLEYPVIRLSKSMALLTTTAQVLPEDEKAAPIVTANSRTSARPSPQGGGVSTTWLDDEYYLQTKDGKQQRIHAATGRAEPYDRQKHGEAQGSDTSRFRSSAGGRMLGARSGGASAPNGSGSVFEREADLYFSKDGEKNPMRLTMTPEREQLPTFSPNSRYVAYVRNNNLGVVDIQAKTDRILTTDGNATTLNGVASYIYYEEVFDRDTRSFWWSPNSEWIAFLKYDDSVVNRLPVFDSLTFTPSEQPRYPRVGDPNPKIKLGLAPASGGVPRYVDFPEHSLDDCLIVRVHWKPEGATALVYVTDRIQSWMDVWEVSTSSNQPARKLFRETTGAWVEVFDPPFYLKDESYLFWSERTGYKHLYHYGKDGKLIRAVTQGEFPVDDVIRIDEKSGWIYFLARKESPISADFYRVKLDGSGFQRLSKQPGNHRINLSPNAKWFIDQADDALTPPRAWAVSVEDGQSRTLDSNPARESAPNAGANSQPRREFLTIKTADGFLMPADLTLPANFDPNKSYPVFFTTYGGPRFPTLSNSWSGGRRGGSQMANEGYVVFRADPRSATNQSAKAAWTAYKRLGEQELKDIEEALRWLIANKPFVDKDRIAFQGSSYGGFMVCYALTHSKMFAAGVAEAPVTDWRDYDSIYTERYMSTPEKNPKGYDDTSAVKAARNLHGRLLLVHGGRDHNVPIHNTMKMARALQVANKDFEMMIYPTAGHGGFGPHSQTMIRDFLKRTLGGPKDRQPTGAH